MGSRKKIMLMKRWVILLAFLPFGLHCTPNKPEEILEAEKQLPEVVDYNYHVKPILSDRCYACHGPDDNAREADLRLDDELLASERLKETGNRAIVPGNLRKSAVFDRLVTDDPELMMPPPESNLQLSATEKAYILKWIEQGAEYKPHWSFIAPVATDPPQADTAWGINEIDAFILARLREQGLSPSAEANKETLIRRLALDLTGLPPTLDEIDAFLADNSPSAYEKVVDQYLDRDAYGERMAAAWMDVSRYADSHGYQDDGMRNMWPWRDWVIASFNSNQPFDAFLTWQLAGDMLPDATRDQILATGFNRNHMQSQEGGVVDEEYRVEYVADRTHTLGKAFMGLSLECARCHDHKYDPISQKEYYQLFGYFNSVNELGIIPYAGEASPTVILPSEEAETKLQAIEAELEPLVAQLDVKHPDYDKGYARWLNGLGNQQRLTLPGMVGHYPMESIADYELANLADRSKPATVQGDREIPLELVEGKSGNAVALNGESWFASARGTHAFERNQKFSIGLWANLQADSLSGPLVARAYGVFNGNRGYMVILNEDGTLSASLNHVAPDNTIEVRTRLPLRVANWHHIVMTYDGSSRAAGLRLYVDGKEAPTETIVDNLQKSILYSYYFYDGETRNWGGDEMLQLGRIGPNQTRMEDVLVDEVTVFDSRLTALEVQKLAGAPSPLADIVSQPTDDWTEAQEEALRTHYVHRISPNYKRVAAQVEALRGQHNEIITLQQEAMVMRELKKPRKTFVLDRGAYDARLNEVQPGTPAVLPAFSENLAQNRLGLAEWLTDPGHPLTARVTVNRYWQMLFGQGIVATPDDFGNQGSLPSHPALLDWLAVTFMSSDWDVKGMLKQIVMSATYRQSSVTSQTLLEADPANRWLARGPSYRMTAEMIRDNALAVSGLLTHKIGGPSVHPYQPEGLWKEMATRNATEYKQDEGDNLYRRSMYTIWKRSTPPPAMISFDASERSFCIVERQKTNSPLQALVLLNDPQFVEAARVLGERMLQEGGDVIEDQVVFAFRLLTSRFPTEKEKMLLVRLFEEERAGFAANPDEARALLAVGEHPYDRRQAVDALAAGAVVASTIMNFDEAYMKR